MTHPSLFRLLALVLALAPFASAEQRVAIVPDVVYGHKDGLAMTFDVFRPQENQNGAAILFMVSGGWHSTWAPPETLQPLFQPYLDQGFTLLAVRHGSSPRYTIPDAVGDVRRAVRFVRVHAQQWGVDANRLGALGMSAGGHLALMLGTTGADAAESGDEIERASSRVAAVVALVPPTDLRVAVWDAPESLPAYRNFPALNLSLELAKTYSPVVHVTADDAPALVIMGGKDELVPPKHGEWIRDAYEREKVAQKLIIFPEAGHGLEGEKNRTALVESAVGWFRTHLLSPK